MSVDISINRIMMLITFLSNLVVARKPYLTSLRLTLKPLRQMPATVLFCTCNQLNVNVHRVSKATKFQCKNLRS